MPDRAAEPAIDTIVHFGAGRGGDLRRHLDRQPRQIVLIEAQAENVEALERVAARHRHVRVIHAAVAGEPGPRTLFRLSLPELSSVRRPTALLDLYPGIEILEERRLEATAPADSLTPLQLNVDHENLLVIDVPGEELGILSSLEQGGHLQAFSNIELRCGRDALYEGSAAAMDVMAWLKKRGYTARESWSDDDPDRPGWLLERNEYYLEAVRLNDELETLRKERETKAEELSEAQRNLTAATENQEKLSERVSDLEEQLRQEQEARKKAEKRAKQREQESAEHQEQQQRLQRDYSELQARADRMREEISRAEAQIDLLARLSGQEPDR